MGSALEFRCASCAKVTAHPVQETDERPYRWDDAHTERFKFLFGVDLWYRKRTRQCSACGSEQQTVELTKAMLGNLVGEIDRLGEQLSLRRQATVDPRISFYPAIYDLVDTVFGGLEMVPIAQLTFGDLARLPDIVDATLDGLDEIDQQRVRFEWGLWDAPTIPPTGGSSLSALLSRLRHPDRSQILRGAIRIVAHSEIADDPGVQMKDDQAPPLDDVMWIPYTPPLEESLQALFDAGIGTTTVEAEDDEDDAVVVQFAPVDGAGAE